MIDVENMTFQELDHFLKRRHWRKWFRETPTLEALFEKSQHFANYRSDLKRLAGRTHRSSQ